MILSDKISPSPIAYFRFYAGLNKNLPRKYRCQSIPFFFSGHPPVRYAIEVLGVPPAEAAFIVINGNPAGLNQPLKNSDRVAVYPPFRSLDISAMSKLPTYPLKKTRFIADVHLGKLARRLRLLGFNTLYRNDFSDRHIINMAVKEKRIILTRDSGLLKNSKVKFGHLIRSGDPQLQLAGVMEHFDLYSQFRPFTRCIVCNSRIRRIKKSEILNRLLPEIQENYNQFYLCPHCDKIYWKGTHFSSMQKLVEEIEKIG